MKTMAIFWIVVMMALQVQSQSKHRIPLVHIKKLDRSKADTVRIKAYVFDIYVCPPCPKGAQCKPCMENNLTAVEEEPVDPQQVSLESRLRIFMTHPDSLKVGKRYIFTVRFRNKKVSPLDNVDLLSFKLL